MTPHDLVTILNEHFTNFDQIFHDHKIEKLKTIGDGYMAAGGVPEPNHSHPIDVRTGSYADIAIHGWQKCGERNPLAPPYWYSFGANDCRDHR